MADVVLLHRPGPDRDAVASFLEKAGLRIVGASQAAHSTSQDSPVWIVEAQVLLDPGAPRPDPRRTILIGQSADMPEPALRLAEAYFLTDLEAAVRRIASGAGILPRMAGAQRPAAADPYPEVLRGLAHALANPLGGAVGWLQLLSSDLAPDDPRNRAVQQVRTDLSRVERLLQMMGWIGGRPHQQKSPVDLFALLKDRATKAEAEGLPVELRLSGGAAILEGDPTPLHLAFDGLFNSYIEERTRAKLLAIEGEAYGHRLTLEFADEGGVLPPDLPIGDLAACLRQTRGPRALALHLLHLLFSSRDGARVQIVAPESASAAHARLRIETPLAVPQHREPDA